MQKSQPKKNNQSKLKNKQNKTSRPKTRVLAKTNYAAMSSIPDKVTNHIQAATEALLNADQFILPRALPTHIVPIHTSITLTVTNTNSVIVAVYPELQFPIHIITTEVDSTTDSVVDPPDSTLANVNDYERAIYNFRPDLVVNNVSQIVPTIINNDSAPGIHFIYTFEKALTYSEDVAIPTAYPGILLDISGSITLTYEGLPAIPAIADIYTLEVVILAQDGTALGSVFPASTTISGQEVTYTNFNAIPPPGAYWRILLKPGNTAHKIVHSSSLLVISSTQVTSNVRKYRPVNRSSDWDDLINTSTRWSFTAGAVTMTNTAAALVNGGNCAAALLPSGVDFPTLPTLAFDYISSLPYNKMTGPLKLGTHVSYIADDLSQYFFKTMDIAAIDGPTMVSVFKTNTGNVSSDVSLQVKVNLMYEFITPNVTRTHLVSPAHAAFFETLVGSITSVCSNNEGLASHNPDHLKKIKDICRKVAQDPGVRAAANAAIKTGSKVITTFGPALLGALL